MEKYDDGTEMWLRAEEETEKRHMERLSKTRGERQRMIEALGLTPETANYSNNQLREMLAKKSGSRDSTATATT